jgi:hypothetical protein
MPFCSIIDYMTKQKTILILPTGKVLAFTVQALATTYQLAYGGTIVNPTKPVKYSEDACQGQSVVV